MEESTGISLFQGGSINIENTNLEEAEDLEDQKRRQEEIQNLLKKELDDFNYDDQSTINSSTNVSIDDANNYLQKYKDCSFDDQLKVLYEVRVREVKALTEDVNKLKNNLIQQKDVLERKYMLAEAEKDRAQISLKEAHHLLVTKTEDIMQLQKDVETQGQSINRLQETVKVLDEDRKTLKHENNDLLEQLTIMQKGLTTNTVSDKQLQESYHAELSQLHHTLDNALSKLDRKEHEFKALEYKLQEKTQEKDILMSEKCNVINTLTANLEDAQHQCRELIKLVETIEQENQRLKRVASSAELADSLRGIGLSDKTEIIKVLQKELEKGKTIQGQQLAEYDNLRQTYAELSKKYAIAEVEIINFKKENEVILTNNDMLQMNFKKQNDEICQLHENLEKHRSLQTENDILQKRISSLQVILQESENKNTQDHSVQVSHIMTSFCEQNELQKEEKDRLEKRLDEANQELALLKQQLIQYEEEVQTLNTKVSLEQERDQLIQTLQQKAEQFEKIILEKRKDKVCVDVRTNTDPESDNKDLLHTKFETDLIEKELQIRVEIKKEFEAKLEKIQSRATPRSEPCKICEQLQEQIKNNESTLSNKNMEIEKLVDRLTKENEFKEMLEKKFEEQKATDQLKQCSDCEKLMKLLMKNESVLQSQTSEINKLMSQQVEDREMLVKILEEWKAKFQKLEASNQDLTIQLIKANSDCEELEKKLIIREKGDEKLIENLKQEAEGMVKAWNKQALVGIQKLTLANCYKIEESRKKIEHISKKADKKINEIEQSYLKSREAIEIYKKSTS